MPTEGKNFLQSRLFVSWLAVSIFFGASAVVAEASEIDEFSDWAAARSVDPVVTGETGAPSLVAMPLASLLAAKAGVFSAGSLEASCVGSDFDFLAVRDGALLAAGSALFLA